MTGAENTMGVTALRSPHDPGFNNDGLEMQMQNSEKEKRMVEQSKYRNLKALVSPHSSKVPSEGFQKKNHRVE